MPSAYLSCQRLRKANRDYFAAIAAEYDSDEAEYTAALEARKNADMSMLRQSSRPIPMR